MPSPGNSKETVLPKGYYEQINRMRKINDDKRIAEEKMARKMKGDTYDRSKLQYVKGPSFIENERKKRLLLMYVDVNITPTK